MTLWSLQHFIFLFVTLAVIIGMMYLVSKVSKKTQDIIFIIVCSIGTLGIFFRYALSLDYTFQTFTPESLGVQLLQNCNFAFILMPLSLIRKNEFFRHYLFNFMMLTASTAFVFYDFDIINSHWISLNTFSFWINHLCIVLMPLMFLASRRFKPNFKYVIHTAFASFMYFAVVGFLSWIQIEFFFFDRSATHSYIFYPEASYILKAIFNVIPIYFVYLIPLWLLIVGLNSLIAFLLRKREVVEY